VQEEVKETSPTRIKSILEGLLRNAYVSLVLDRDDRAEGFQLLARKLYASYESQIPKGRTDAMSLGPFSEIDRVVLSQLLDPKQGLVPEARAILRTRKGMPAETAPGPVLPAPSPAPAAATNAPAK
jgi:hypothetical protein